MTIDYRTDDSFFTTVFPPFIFYGWPVKSWLLDNPWGKYRYIRDYEAEQNFWSAEQLQELYPGVKLIGFVVNPWARMYYAYTQLCSMKDQRSAPIDLSQIETSSFEKFIKSLKITNYSSDFWFTLTTPMSKWFDYKNDVGEIVTVDYLIKDITLEQDFKGIQDYFRSDVPLNLEDDISNYQQYYTDETRDIVADIFKEDINRFGYEF